ncbi:alkaline phosphatase family protein [Enterococcus sp. LJL51]|uniref:alkaline phosphatase family protein n=1 Tax=Enterococcus sp. LJL51 TaxID=3416656 RepID=UPI003CF2DA39
MPNKDKLILIILDGCRYDTAAAQCGFLNHLVEHNQAVLTKVQAEMPSNSRPLYEVLMTGVPTYKNGIYTNAYSQRSTQTSIFQLVKNSGGTTGAAAYYWYSELYNRAPYNIREDRIQQDADQQIQHGIFYSEDTYPDSHLFADANYIINSDSPDFLLVHSMNIDDIGHKYTAASKEYQWAVNQADNLLGEFIPAWLEKGYQIIVTADHGMDEFGLHGGNLAAHREVPLYIYSKKISRELPEIVKQLEIAPLICSLLGIKPSAEMVGLEIAVEG